MYYRDIKGTLPVTLAQLVQEEAHGKVVWRKLPEGGFEEGIFDLYSESTLSLPEFTSRERVRMKRSRGPYFVVAR